MPKDVVRGSSYSLLVGFARWFGELGFASWFGELGFASLVMNWDLTVKVESS